MAGGWFNLVTDECVTVNALYTALTPSINVITQVGIRAVDEDSHCLNILVYIRQCSAYINEVPLSFTDKYSVGGVSVRRYRNRVRISVPNCNDLTLVMWVFCETRTLDNPNGPGITSEMIKVVVMRGLNQGHSKSHGLIGK